MKRRGGRREGRRQERKEDSDVGSNFQIKNNSTKPKSYEL